VAEALSPVKKVARPAQARKRFHYIDDLGRRRWVSASSKDRASLGIAARAAWAKYELARTRAEYAYEEYLAAQKLAFGAGFGGSWVLGPMYRSPGKEEPGQ
jgi:hypothetical protein